MEQTQAICGLCGEPMPPGEEMFKYHGYSGPCPKPPLNTECDCAATTEGKWADKHHASCASLKDRPIPSPNHPPGIKVRPALCFERGTLSIYRQGFGDEDGDGYFTFSEENIEWEQEEGKAFAVVKIGRGDLVFLRDHLNEIFPASAPTPSSLRRARRGRE